MRDKVAAAAVLIRSVPPRTAAGAVFFLLLLVLARLSLDFGVTFDEYAQQEYGERVYDYFASLSRDKTALIYSNLYLYGGMFDLSCRVVQKIFGSAHPYDVRHVVNAVYCWLGLIFTFRLAKIIGGDRSGWLALALMLISPLYVGHGMNNPKDIPLATFFTMGLYYLARVAREYPRVGAGSWVRVGAAVALALNVRVGGVLLLCYLGALVGGLALRDIYRRRRAALPDAGRACRALALLAPTAVLFGTAFWPWAQASPFRRSLEAFRAFAHFDHSERVLFAGRSVSSTELPWDYLPRWFGVTTPLLVLLGLALSAALLIRRKRAGGIAGLWLALGFPLVYAACTGATIYDGNRHFLFVYPAMAACSAVALVVCGEYLFARSRPLGLAAVAAAALLAFHPARYMISSYPHWTSYFNELVGGTRGAFTNYEQDYWAACYKQAVEWLAERARQERRQLRVEVRGAWHLPPLYRKDGLEFVGYDQPRDYVLTAMRADKPGLLALLERKAVHKVEADGAPLCLVFEAAESPLQ